MLDTTFANCGALRLLAGNSDFGADDAEMAAGRIGIAGSYWEEEGSLSYWVGLTISTDGLWSALALPSANSLLQGATWIVAAIPDGRFDFVGATYPNLNIVVARTSTSGGLDQAFGVGGIERVELTTASTTAFSASDSSDGKVIVSGWFVGDGHCGTIDLRLDTQGSIDASYSASGFRFENFSCDGADDDFVVATLDDDASLFVAPVAGSWVIQRADPHGTVDWQTPLPGVSMAHAVLDDAGRLIDAIPVGRQQVDVFRVLPDGSFDPSFGTNGIVQISYPDGYSAVDLQSDNEGRVLLAVEPEDDLHRLDLVRITPDGSRDDTFGTVSITHDRGVTLTRLLVDSGDRIYIVGQAHGYLPFSFIERLQEPP